jgi:hypothetical protein
VSRAETAGYPVEVDFDAPLTVARWRPLVHWLLVIPHELFLYILNIAFGVVTFIAWFAILFTGNIPEAMFGFMVAYLRYQWRVASYALFLRESYPKFDIDASANRGDDPAWLGVERPERLSRGLIFVKWLLAIPHAIVLTFVYIGFFLPAVIGFFAVIITGRWPQGLRRFIAGTARWHFRVTAYTGLLTDRYPPFSLA